MVEKSLETTQLPKHIAIIMDGNGRWAQKKIMPRLMGHKKGVETVRKVVKFCLENGIEALTLFAFSSENWKRTKREIAALMSLIENILIKETKELNENKIKLSFIGDIAKLSPTLQGLIQESQELTQNNTKLKLSIALNYGGKWDIANATKLIAQKVAAGNLAVTEIDQALIAKHLCLADIPEVDLLIRTSGEQRLSNFLLWQIAYAEIYFTEELWPDFDEKSMAVAVNWYSQRQRRFGAEGAINVTEAG